MNTESVIERLEQYRHDFELHKNSYAKDAISQQMLGFLSALSYSDMPYSVLKVYGDHWTAMSAEVSNLIYGEFKEKINE